MRRTRSTMWIPLACLLACGPGLPIDDPMEASTSTSAGSGASTGAPAPTTGSAGSGETGPDSAAASTTADATTSARDDTSGFLIELDGVTSVDPCNVFTQDCPRGEKCTPYASDGGGSWNSALCSPVMENPAQLHEPCFATGGGTSGIDNCDFGLMCWDVDAMGNGKCIELCKGSPEAGYCDEPGTNCAVYSEGYLALCLGGCDPLAQDCDPSDVCVGNPNGEGFLCVLDASGDEGQAHDPCDYPNACDPGLICNDPTAADECDPNAEGCCEPFCDLSDPNADMNCPGVGQVCNPYFEEGTAPPGYENVGYCALPM